MLSLYEGLKNGGHTHTFIVPNSRPPDAQPFHVLLTIQAGSSHASTSAEVLGGLLGKHPVVPHILEFRGVNKYMTT